MNSKLALWLGVLALISAPAVSVRAQEGLEGGEPPEGVEAWEGGPEQPGMGMDRKGRLEMRDEKGLPGNRGKIRRMMRGGHEMGGTGFMPEEEETLAVIEKHDASFGRKLKDLSEIAPAKYRMALHMAGKLFAVARMAQDESIEKDAVRALALEFESRELSLKYNRASDADKKAIKEKLKPILAELFDLKSRGQELRVKHMESEIGRLKKKLEGRKAKKSKIVEQRLEQITGEGDNW